MSITGERGQEPAAVSHHCLLILPPLLPSFLSLLPLLKVPPATAAGRGRAGQGRWLMGISACLFVCSVARVHGDPCVVRRLRLREVV